MSSFLQWCQSQYFLWDPPLITAGICFVLQWLGIIFTGIILGIGLSEMEGGYDIK